MNKVKHYLQLMRIHQWVKNFFIFLPLFFSFKMDHIPLLIADLWAFVGFCLIASSIYIINDWNDIATDRLHPEKRNRPLASGAINKKEASLMILSLVAVGVSVYIFVLGNYIALALLVSYFILNIFYSLRLNIYRLLILVLWP